jgi:hypothetical protein
MGCKCRNLKRIRFRNLYSNTLMRRKCSVECRIHFRKGHLLRRKDHYIHHMHSQLAFRLHQECRVSLLAALRVAPCSFESLEDKHPLTCYGYQDKLRRLFQCILSILPHTRHINEFNCPNDKYQRRLNIPMCTSHRLRSVLRAGPQRLRHRSWLFSSNKRDCQEKSCSLQNMLEFSIRRSQLLQNQNRCIGRHSPRSSSQSRIQNRRQDTPTQCT